MQPRSRRTPQPTPTGQRPSWAWPAALVRRSSSAAVQTTAASSAGGEVLRVDSVPAHQAGQTMWRGSAALAVLWQGPELGPQCSKPRTGSPRRRAASPFCAAWTRRRCACACRTVPRRHLQQLQGRASARRVRSPGHSRRAAAPGLQASRQDGGQASSLGPVPENSTRGPAAARRNAAGAGGSTEAGGLGLTGAAPPRATAAAGASAPAVPALHLEIAVVGVIQV